VLGLKLIDIIFEKNIFMTILFHFKEREDELSVYITFSFGLF
jgi:hypothetical protein